MADAKIIVANYARMWPREIFYGISGDAKKPVAKGLELLSKAGIYVLYRDDVPYYVGKATKLRSRLWLHAMRPPARYYNFWNFFSAFVVEDPKQRNEVEGILIAAMPTANSAQPRLKRERFPKEVTEL